MTPAAAGDLPVPEGGGDAQPDVADRATGPAADTTGEKYSIRKKSDPIYCIYILYMYIATASQSHPLHRPCIGRFHCWSRFSVVSVLQLTCLQLKSAYNFLLASGLPFMQSNKSSKYTSSVDEESFNNRLLNDAPPPPRMELCNSGKKKGENPTFRSFVIQILKIQQFDERLIFYLPILYIHGLRKWEVDQWSSRLESFSRALSSPN